MDFDGSGFRCGTQEGGSWELSLWKCQWRLNSPYVSLANLHAAYVYHYPFAKYLFFLLLLFSVSLTVM